MNESELLSKQIRTIEAEVESLGSQILEHIGEQGETASRLSSLEHQLSKSTRNAGNIELEIRATIRSITKVKQDLPAAASKLEQKLAQQRSITDKLKRKQDELKNLDSQREELESTLHKIVHGYYQPGGLDFTGGLTEYERHLPTCHKTKIRQHMAEYKRLQGIHEDKQKQAQALAARCGRAHHELQQIERELETVESGVAQARERKYSLDDQLTQLTRQVDTLYRKESSAQSSVETLQDQQADLRADEQSLAELAREKNSLQQDAYAEILRLKGELVDAELAEEQSRLATEGHQQACPPAQPRKGNPHSYKAIERELSTHYIEERDSEGPSNDTTLDSVVQRAKSAAAVVVSTAVDALINTAGGSAAKAARRHEKVGEKVLDAAREVYENAHEYHEEKPRDISDDINRKSDEATRAAAKNAAQSVWGTFRK